MRGLCRYNTVMTPVINSLQQHIAAATTNEPVSTDDAAFRQELLPKLSGECKRGSTANHLTAVQQSNIAALLLCMGHMFDLFATVVTGRGLSQTVWLLCCAVLCYTELLKSLRQPPEELLRQVSGEEQSDDGDSEDASDDPATATPPAPSGVKKQPGKAGAPSAAADRAAQSVDSGGWPLLKQLRHQLQQHLRRQQYLQLAAVAPQLSKLRDTAIPLPADDMTADMLPPLPLKSALERYFVSESPGSLAATAPAANTAGASVLLSASGQVATAAAGEGSPAETDSDSSSGSWLCIAAFDKQVAVLPTKTRPKRLLMLASDGSIHAFLLKGRDDLRVDEHLMQFMRASNALLAADSTTSPTAAPGPAGQAPVSAAAAAVAGWSGGRKVPLRARPYSITPFGRRAGLVQWVRHTTSLFGLFRNWQQCAAERYQAMAAAKRDAAAAAVAAGGHGDKQPDRQPPAAGAAGGKGAADGVSSNVLLPLIVAASRPTDAFYARLLPALQAAGLPVGSARSSWPASKFMLWCCLCPLTIKTSWSPAATAVVGAMLLDASHAVLLFVSD